MPYRTTSFATGYYYHVFNRGVNKQQIFINPSDYKRFYKSIAYYQLEGPKPRFSLFQSGTNKLIDENKKIVDIIAFCLMPNHFHILLKQTRDGGVTEFMRKLSDSYSKYFNVRHNHSGPVLQGEFKAVLVENNEQLLHLNRYIHINPLVSGLVEDLNDYLWSSYHEYVGSTKLKSICEKEIILDQFPSIDQYKQFLLDQRDYGSELEIIKHQLLDPS